MIALTRLAASDVIFDFDFVEVRDPGGDIIDISDAAGLAFLIVGSNTFAAGSTSQVRVFYDEVTNNTFVQLDTDADTGAEAQIRLIGEHALAELDFLL